jgi:hypothetical protein
MSIPYGAAGPVKPRRNRKSAKKAGASFERVVADYLRAVLDDDRIDRRVKSGANDRGDIAGVRTMFGARVCLEVKNVATLNFSGWLREAATEAANDDAPYGIVIAKRRGLSDPGEQYAVMTLGTLAALLLGGPDTPRGV